MAFPSYSTGTVSVAAGGTVVTGVGTGWTATNVRPGDEILIAGREVVVMDFTDATHLVINPWQGTTVSGVAYKLIQSSPLRYNATQVMVEVSDIVATMTTDGYFVFVKSTETEPNPSYGKDGQYAMQPVSGKLWYKEAGVWNYVGINKGFALPLPWSSAKAYVAYDVVSFGGSTYVCILAHTNHSPPNATYWTLLASVGPAATVTVGTVTTGAPGSSASVTNVGTSGAALLNFNIPAGVPGAAGAITSLSGGTDVNTVTARGEYYIVTPTGNTNTPLGSAANYWHLTVGGPGGGYCWQQMRMYLGPDQVWVRTQQAGTWGAWKRLATSNDISPSRSVLSGLQISNNTTAPATHMDVSAGTAYSDSASPYSMTLASGITKRVDAAWAAGNNQGGLDAGSVVNNTTYSFWEILNTTSGVADVLISASGTNPSLPPGFSEKKYLGSMFYGSGAWLQFRQIGNSFTLVTKTLCINDTALSTTHVAYSLPIPIGRRVLVRLNGRTFNPSGSCSVYVRSDFESAQAANLAAVPYATLGHGITNATIAGHFECWSDLSGQIYAVAGSPSTTFQATVLGWMDPDI